MTTDPKPRVGTFRFEARSPRQATSACVIHSAGGTPHGVEITVRQAKALNLELSRAIVAYELIAMDEREDLGTLTA
jgi:hypothetical protein